MCGVAGILGRRDEARLKRMTDAMIHRGPDDEGFHFGEGISLGMRRLSIIDVAGGHQPISNEDGTRVIVYNGEIYNYLSLKEELEKRGHRFRTRSDTETVLHAYEEYGKECVQRFNGMFVFAIWDSATRELFIARDRLGIKPVYYAYRGGTFLFGSEARVIMASGLVEKEIDTNALQHFLSLYNMPFPMTMFRGVRQLPPGHRLTVRAGEEPAVEEWWDVPRVPSAEKNGREEQDLAAELRSLLEASVRRRLMSEVPLGAFLSGGIDSSIVVGLMARMLERPVATFSVGFRSQESRYDERSYAKTVAERYGTDHTEVIVTGSDVLAAMPTLIRAMDLPSGDAIQTWFISEAARRRVTVSLSGLGGDELFAGYQQFRFIPEVRAFQERWSRRGASLRRLGAALARRAPSDLKTRMKFRLLLDALAHDSPFEGQYDLSRSVFDGEEKRSLLSPEFLDTAQEWTAPVDIVRRYAGRLEGLDLIDALTYLELKTYMAHMLLRDTDVMSMANSLEIRVPLIDYTVVEFVARNVPARLKRKEGSAKHLLIEACRDILPDEVIFRRKRGFEFPMPKWLRGELRPLVEDCLDSGVIRRRGIFNAREIERLKKRFFAPHPRVPYLKIWIPVVLEMWFREFVDS